MGVGLNSYDWQNLAQDYINSKTYSKSYYANNASYNSGAATQTGYAAQTRYATQTISSQGNYCTDGKDDGHIGILSVVGNVVEGAGKAVINGVKGMFTDKNGNFSLLKTASTVALGAACVAFPAVGLTMCGFGVVAGGTKLVKNFANALGAKTDAEAKDAWEAVGDGALTTAVSAVGAKASFKAVQTSAGAASEFAKLGDDATLLQKASALGKDMVTSTKNNFVKLRTFITNISDAVKIQNANKNIKGYETADISKMNADQLVKMEESYYNAKANLQILEENESAVKIANNMQTRADASQAAKSTLDSAKTALSEAQKALKAAEKTGDDILIADKLNDLNAAREAYNSVKNTVGFKNNLMANVGNRLSETQTAQCLKTIKTLKAAVSKSTFQNILKSMSKDGQAVINFLTKESGSYYEAVNKYGYKNVAEALEVFASYRLIDETV